MFFSLSVGLLQEMVDVVGFGGFRQTDIMLLRHILKAVPYNSPYPSETKVLIFPTKKTGYQGVIILNVVKFDFLL